jgi:putative transposase
MICVEDRRKMMAEVEAAHRAGARLAPACELVGIRARTIQRWKADSGLERGDGRAHVMRPLPGHALRQAEREQIVRVANESRFAQLPPARIVPMLADEGTYIASESSFHRVLRAQGQLHHRGRARAPQKMRPPSTHIATAINQVWTWDMSAP